MLYAQRMVLTFAIIKCFDGLFHSLLYGKLQIIFIQMWEHATDSPPKASLWQLSQQQSPKAAAGLQAETTAVTASHGSFLSQAFPLVYGARLGETGHGLKKERFRLCIRKPFFTWWTLIFRSRLVLRKVLQPPSLVISKPQWTQNHKQPARSDLAPDPAWSRRLSYRPLVLPFTRTILCSHECLQLPWTSTSV